MRVVLLIAALLLSTASWGQFFDGNKLLLMCTSQARSFADGGCVGFIAGVSDTLKAAENQRAPNDRICVPGEVTTVELKTTVLKYLNLVPQFHDYVASFLVEMALLSAYPCNPRTLAERDRPAAAAGG